MNYINNTIIVIVFKKYKYKIKNYNSEFCKKMFIILDHAIIGQS